MKNLFLLLLLNLFFIHHSLACDPLTYSFCEIVSEYETNSTILYGEIMEHNDNGIVLKINQVLRGNETRDVVNIWSGTDIDCNGPFDMSAQLLGQVGEEIICFVELIETPNNNWDVIGDYRRYSSINYINALQVNNGIVSGFITQNIIYTPLESFEIDFVQCFTPLTSQELKANTIKLLNNFTQDNLLFAGINNDNITYKIFDHLGRVLNIGIIKNKQVQIQQYQSGLYIISIETPDKQQISFRFYKK